MEVKSGNPTATTCTPNTETEIRFLPFYCHQGYPWDLAPSLWIYCSRKAFFGRTERNRERSGRQWGKETERQRYRHLQTCFTGLWSMPSAGEERVFKPRSLFMDMLTGHTTAWAPRYWFLNTNQLVNKYHFLTICCRFLEVTDFQRKYQVKCQTTESVQSKELHEKGWNWGPGGGTPD